MEKWRLTGKSREEYNYGTVATGAANERDYGFIASKPEVTQASGYGALVLPFDLDAMKGKRVHFSAAVKTDTVDGWAGLWMRFDRKPNEDIIVLDNMGNRPITGTTKWCNYEIVLDVPDEATAGWYGMALKGTGRAEISDVQFHEVSQDVPVTAQPFRNNI